MFSMDILKPFMLEVNDNHSPSGFHSISSYLGDDTMMLPQYLIYVGLFEEVLRLFESQFSWG